jgi:glycosyltransferase involved in cell wall biosynthesis
MRDGQLHSSVSNVSSGKPKSLIVEGWRFVAHSYAMVNQWQLLAFLRRPDVSIKVVDLPYYQKRWQSQSGLFDQSEETALKSIASAIPGECADVTLRISVPFDFTPSHSRRTVIFGTSETQELRPDQFRDLEAYNQFHRNPPGADLRIVTPSRWSAEGFYSAGFGNDQVLIIPHGCDTGTFRPMPDLRAEIRSKFSCLDDDFVFLSVGAMTGNKGIDLLLQAFAQVYKKFPRARLILKGLDSLYRSKDFLDRYSQTMSQRDLDNISARVTYLGDSYSNAKMAKLYQAADAYVSPYRAEGFNIPVLEAAASAIPVICTRGGATDEFVTDEFARRIDSRKVSVPIKDQHGYRLEPSLDHLIFLMSSVIEDREWRVQAMAAGPAYVRANFTWDSVSDMLIEQLWD